MIVGNIMVSLFLLAEAGFLLKISNKLKIKQNRPKKKKKPLKTPRRSQVL